MGTITVTPRIAIDERELDIQFVRASGPGGQNVNKVATAAQLRFDVANSPSLPDDVRARLLRQAAGRINTEGALIIDARRFRSQERNRTDAIERLVELVRRATVTPKKRRPTKPTAAAKRRRLEEKKKRGEDKRLRRPVRGENH
jgi:ribosome-associated protein